MMLGLIWFLVPPQTKSYSYLSPFARRSQGQAHCRLRS